MGTVESHPTHSNWASWTTHDLWALLFTVVDEQLALQARGQLRKAVIMRRHARDIGTTLRDRYRDEFRI